MRSLDDLTMYVYGLLDPDDEEEMREHLQSCAACARLRRRISAEHALLKGAFKRASPEMPTWVSGATFRDRPQF